MQREIFNFILFYSLFFFSLTFVACFCRAINRKISTSNSSGGSQSSSQSSIIMSSTVNAVPLTPTNSSGVGSSTSSIQLMQPQTPETPSLVVSDGLVVEQSAEGEWTYDPNEPRYCICNQVSYGDMVACDNEDVMINILVVTG